MRKICKTCAAFGEVVVVGSVPEWARGYGSCRLKPAKKGYAAWPMVKPDGWCMKWQEDIF